jgi:hypothetical protein
MSSDVLQGCMPQAGALDLAVAGNPAATTLGLVELLLKDPARVDHLANDVGLQHELLSRLLLITQAGYLIFGAVMVLVLNLSPAPELVVGGVQIVPPASWHDFTALSLPAAYNIGLILASCVCLPSFYFYNLLAGVPMSFRQIALVVAKGSAANAVMLLGILPIYVAIVLGCIVLNAPTTVLHLALLAGLLLPFVAGLWGLRELYRSIQAQSAALPHLGACRRDCFLRRLTLAWTAVYSAVVPVMIYRLWDAGADWLRLF